MKKKSCNYCYGFGMWAIGNPDPMGPMDAKDGMPTKKCFSCKSNANPIIKLKNNGKSKSAKHRKNV